MKLKRAHLIRLALVLLWALAASGCGNVNPDSRMGRLTEAQLATIQKSSLLPLDGDAQQAKTSQEVQTYKDIRYYSGPEEHPKKHRLDLYLPKGKEDWPLVHFVHGGAWFFGHKDQRIPFIGDYTILGEGLASRGIGVAISNYRLSPEFKHPAHIHDVGAAWSWLCRNVEDYGGDPDRMFLMGQSAGGHLVSLLATHPELGGLSQNNHDRIRSVISISGVYDLRHGPKGAKKPTGLIKKAFGTNPETLKEASPLDQVSGKSPPFVILTAERDPMMLRQQAETFAEKLDEKAVDYRFWIIPRKNHLNSIGDIGRSNDTATAWIADYILNYGSK